jgi:hypothetical protein
MIDPLFSTIEVKGNVSAITTMASSGFNTALPALDESSLHAVMKHAASINHNPMPAKRLFILF